MFAALSLENEPIKLKQVFHLAPAWPNFGFAETWVQAAGSIAAICILVWVILRYLRRRGVIADESAQGEIDTALWGRAFLILLLVSGALYLVFGLAFLFKGFLNKPTAYLGAGATVELVRLRVLTLAAGSALLAVMVWPLRDLLGLRWHVRRIWAIASLSLKEAIRRRVLWVFLIVLLFFLFGMWFLPTKPEDQIRSYVQAVFLVFAVLLVLTLSLVAAFSLPTDIKSQTIHTILTKPVERFELLLGRFLGFSVLMTAVLAVLTGFSLLYLLRELDKEAVQESLKARVPLNGELQFYKNDQPDPDKGTNVGKVWEFRKYIVGDESRTNRQAAVWKFAKLPGGLQERESVPCEFAFDIHRTSKGEGIKCDFACRAWHWQEGTPEEQRQRVLAYRQERTAETGTSDAEFNDFVNSMLILKYGYYEPPQTEISNLRTAVVQLPVALFQDPQELKNELAREADKAPSEYKTFVDARRPIETDAQRQSARDREAGLKPSERRHAFLYRELPAFEAHLQKIIDRNLRNKPDKLEIRVTCASEGQYIGMAKNDLYLLDKEYAFWFNFLKGASGIWLMLLVVLGLNIALSTYLSAIVGWLAGLFWLLLGLLREFIESLINSPDMAGGGPMESLYRLAHRQNFTAQVTETAAYRVALGSDEVSRVFFKGLLWIVIDYDRFWFTDYVAEGFDVAVRDGLCVSLLYLLAWLVPIGLLGYYTIKWREVAAAQ